MTFKELALTRITPKFYNGNNFKNVLRFTSDIFDRSSKDVDLIKNLKNMGSDSPIVLNEIGKILGIYPRPLVAIGITGDISVVWDISHWDTVPWFTDDIKRELTDTEYAKVLRAYAVLTTCSGTIDDWSEIIGKIVNARAYIVNKRSTYDIIILRTLSKFEKNLIEVLLNDLDNLTVKKGFLGTSSTGQSMQWGVTPWGLNGFVENW